MQTCYSRKGLNPLLDIFNYHLESGNSKWSLRNSFIPLCKLLSEGDISYTDALAHAQSIESAEDDAKKQGGSASLQPVQYTQKGVKFASFHTSPTCYCCGSLHLAPASPHKKKVCRYCKTKGHLDKVCCAKAHALAKSDPPATGPSLDKKPPSSFYLLDDGKAWERRYSKSGLF